MGKIYSSIYYAVIIASVLFPSRVTRTGYLLPVYADYLILFDKLWYCVQSRVYTQPSTL